jgi:hypothetical protein
MVRFKTAPRWHLTHRRKQKRLANPPYPKGSIIVAFSYMLTKLCILVLLAAVGASVALGARCQADPVAWKRWVDQGEPYSFAACDDTDPINLFEGKRMDFEMATTDVIKLHRLCDAAKDGLEAGLIDKAKLYAEMTLAMANEDRFRNAPPVSFEASAEGDAVFIGNLVLGRIALLQGDAQEAEKRLLLSGQIKDGMPTFWGPNMTLALELLKRKRTEVVLQFLEECAKFWRADCHPKADAWAAVIRAGGIPDFGANLIYFGQ